MRLWTFVVILEISVPLYAEYNVDVIKAKKVAISTNFIAKLLYMI